MITTPSTSSSPRAGGETIGYIGCSNTTDAVVGYHAVGGNRIWEPINAYAGGTVSSWGTPGEAYWSLFESSASAAPPSSIWWQLCIRADESDTDSYTAARAVVELVGSKAPGATIYVSPLHGFVEPHVCPAIGPDGEARADALAARLIDEGLVQPGPEPPELVGPDSAGGGTVQVRGDGCHPNRDGQKVLGTNLLDSFG